MKLEASVFYVKSLFFVKGKVTQALNTIRGSIICIFVSLIPLISILILTDSMIQGITERVIGLSSGALQIRFAHNSDITKNEEIFIDFAKDLLQNKDISGAWCEFDAMGLAVCKNGRTGANIRAVFPDIFAKNTAFIKLFTLCEGNAKDLQMLSSNQVVIGKKLAQNLDIHVNDTIRLITMEVGNTNNILPKSKAFKVTAIISSGYQELDALWVFLPLKSGFRLKGAQAVINLDIKEPFSSKLGHIQAIIKETLPKGTYIYTYKELNTARFSNLYSTKIMLIFLMFVLVLVACVNISSGIIMLVMERKKEIAMLKCIGATDKDILCSFLIVGGISGVIGSVIGLPLGLLLGVNINTVIAFVEKIFNYLKTVIYFVIHKDIASLQTIHLLDSSYYLQDVSIIIPVLELIAIIFGTLFLSIIVALLPALKASREKPVSIFREI